MFFVDVLSFLSRGVLWFLAIFLLLALVVTIVGAIQHQRNRAKNREMLHRQRNAQAQAQAAGVANTNTASTERDKDRDRDRDRDRYHHDRSSRRGIPAHSPVNNSAVDDDDMNVSSSTTSAVDEEEDWTRQRKRGTSYERERGSSNSGRDGTSPAQSSASNQLHHRNKSNYDAVKKASKRGSTQNGSGKHGKQAQSNLDPVSLDSMQSFQSSPPMSPLVTHPIPVSTAEVDDPMSRLPPASLGSSHAGNDEGIHEEGGEGEHEATTERESGSTSPSDAKPSKAADSSKLRAKKQSFSWDVPSSLRKGNIHSNSLDSISGMDGGSSSSSSSTHPSPNQSSILGGFKLTAATSSQQSTPQQLHQLSAAAATLLAMFPQLSPSRFQLQPSDAEALLLGGDTGAGANALPSTDMLLYNQLLSLITHSHSQHLCAFVQGTLRALVETEVQRKTINQVQGDVLLGVIEQHVKEEEASMEANEGAEATLGSGVSDQLLAMVVDATKLTKQSLEAVETNHGETSIASGPNDASSATTTADTAAALVAAAPNTAGAKQTPPSSTALDETKEDNSSDADAKVISPPTSTTGLTFTPPTSASTLPAASTLPPTTATIPAIAPAPLVIPAFVPPPVNLSPLPPTSLSAQQLIAQSLAFLGEGHKQRMEICNQLCLPQAASNNLSYSSGSYNSSQGSPLGSPSASAEAVFSTDGSLSMGPSLNSSGIPIAAISASPSPMRQSQKSSASSTPPLHAQIAPAMHSSVNFNHSNSTGVSLLSPKQQRDEGINTNNGASNVSSALVYAELHQLLQQLHQNLSDRLQTRMTLRLQAQSQLSSSATMTTTASNGSLSVKDHAVTTLADSHSLSAASLKQAAMVEAIAKEEATRLQSLPPQTPGTVKGIINNDSIPHSPSVHHHPHQFVFNVTPVSNSPSSSSAAAAAAASLSVSAASLDSQEQLRPLLLRPASTGNPSPRTSSATSTSVSRSRTTAPSSGSGSIQTLAAQHALQHQHQHHHQQQHHSHHSQQQSAPSSSSSRERDRELLLRTPPSTATHAANMLFTPSPGSVAARDHHLHHVSPPAMPRHTVRSPVSSGHAPPPPTLTHSSSAVVGSHSTSRDHSSSSSASSLQHGPVSVQRSQTLQLTPVTGVGGSHAAGSHEKQPPSPAGVRAPWDAMNFGGSTHASAVAPPLVPRPRLNTAANNNVDRLTLPNYNTSTFPPKKRSASMGPADGSNSVMLMMKNLGREATQRKGEEATDFNL